MIFLLNYVLFPKIFLVTKQVRSTEQGKSRKRERERDGGDLDSRFEVGLDGGVEASEGVVAGDIEILLLFDVVFVVLLADRIDSGQDVDHAHLLLLFVFYFLQFNLDRSRERKREKGKKEKKKLERKKKLKSSNFFRALTICFCCSGLVTTQPAQ